VLASPAPALASGAAVHVASRGEPPALPATAPAGGRELDEAKRLYDEGKRAFDLADYGDALVAWRKAYAMLPQDEASRVIASRLVYNISEAEAKAYAVDRDVTHLRKAKLLLEDYIAEHERLYGNDAQATQERADARLRLAELTRQLEEAERGAAVAPAPTPSPVAPAPGTSGVKDYLAEAKLMRLRELKADPAVAPDYRHARGLIAGGWATFGVGAGVLVIGAPTVALANLTDEARDASTSEDYALDNRAWGAITAGIGVGLMAIGGGLLAGGYTWKKKLEEPTPQNIDDAKAKLSARREPVPLHQRLALSPWGGRGGAGAVLTVRF